MTKSTTNTAAAHQGNVYVAKSPIHGQGLFAQQPIIAGAVIGFVDGVPTTADDPHVLWLDDKQGVRVKGVFKYVNHSPTPNACFYDDLTLVALRDIRANEEITHDYGIVER